MIKNRFPSIIDITKTTHKEWIIVILFAIIVLVLRWPTLEQPFENDSGSIAYHARLISQGEPLYGSHHPAHHLPGAYYIYALAFFLFGDGVWAVNFFLIFWIILTVYFLYLLTSKLIDKPTGVLAGILFAFLSVDVGFMGSMPKLEQFANLPRIAVIYVLLVLVMKKSAPWKFVFVGILSAIVFLFKAVYLSPLVISFFAIAQDYLLTRREHGCGRLAISRSMWIVVGFISGLVPVLLYFHIYGLLPRFLLVFTMGQKYVNILTGDSPFGLAIISPLFWLAKSQFLLTISFLSGIYFFIRYRKTIRNWSYLLIIFLWFLLSYAEASATLTGLLHYYIPLLPPFVMVVSWFLLDLSRKLRETLGKKHHYLPAILQGSLILLAFSQTIYNNIDMYYYYYRYKLYHDSYEKFIFAGFPYNSLIHVGDIVKYVKEHTSPDDYILVWSDDIQIYYLADRKCPIDIIWPLYSEATGHYSRLFQSNTRYIILGDIFFEFFPPWLYEELDAKYRLETIIHGRKLFSRIEQ